MKLLHKVAIGTAVCTLSVSAHAAFLNNSFGLVAPEQTITFESAVLADSEPVTTQFQSLGATFSTAFANPNPDPFPHISGNRLGNFVPNAQYSSLFTVDFVGLMGEAAFALVTQPGTSTIAAWRAGVLVESASAGTHFTSDTNYFGFSGIVFDRITIQVASSDKALLFDNLQTVSAVPEPASQALLAAGLGVLGLIRRRRPS